MNFYKNKKNLPFVLVQLTKDKIYLIVILLAPVFWFSMYYFGTSITGPDWLNKNIFLYLQLALLYPIVEELVFRGLLQEKLWQTPIRSLSFCYLSMPNIITSIVFTSFHFISHSPIWAMAVFIPSLVFGFFRDRYQHVLPAIILHVFYNGGYFLLYGK